MAIELGAAYISILPSTDKLAPAIRKELAGIDRDMGRSGRRSGRGFGSAFLAGFAGLAKSGGIAALAGGSLLGGAGLKTAAELEQTKIGFETMLGSAKAADRFLAKIKKTAAQTPFELPGLTSSSQKLLAFGFQVEDVIPTLTTLGDAASGLGLGSEGLDRLVMAVGQIQAKGKVQGEELLQLTEAGIPAQKILQNELGLTADRYADLQKKGKILAEDAIPALLSGVKNGTSGIAGETAKFGGLMEKQSQSVSGLASTLKDTLLVGMADALEPLMPLLKQGLGGAIKGLTPLMSSLGTGLERVVGFFTAGGPEVSRFRDIFAQVGGVLSSIFQGAVTQFGKFERIFRKTGSAVLGFVLELLPVFQDFGQRLMDVLGPGLTQVSRLLRTQLLPAFNNLLPVLAPVAKFILGILADAVIGAVRGAIQALKGFINIVAGIFKLVTALVKGDWSAAWDALKQIFFGVIDAVIGAFKVWWNIGILSLFKKGALALVSGWKGLWSGLQSLGKKALSATGTLIKKALLGYVKLFVFAIKKYLGLWKRLFVALKDLAVLGWKVLRSAFGGAFAAIRTVIVEAVKRYLGLWKSLFTGLRDGAVKGWRLVKTAYTKAVDALKTAFSKGVDAIKDIWDELRDAAAAPAKFVIETVYNNGIRKMIGALPGVGTPREISVNGFSRGGWTGPGGRMTPAGVVHADEFVVSKRARRLLEGDRPGALDYMNRTGRWPGYASGGRVWPLPGGTASTYPGHDGVDLNAPGDLGKPYLAAAGGTISYVGTGRGYGLAVFQRGPYGELVYGHSLRTLVSPGQSVRAGQPLGLVGSSGNSTGPHLHFGFPGGSYQSALAFLSGASRFAGVSGSGKAGFESGGLIALAKRVASGIKGMSSDGWPGIFRQMAGGAAGSVRSWINDKIPGPGPIPGGIFDSGGILAPGAIAMNMSKRPEAVFTHRQFREFADGGSSGPRRVELVVGERRFDAYMREVAEDTYNGERAFDGTARRMHRS